MPRPKLDQKSLEENITNIFEENDNYWGYVLISAKSKDCINYICRNGHDRTVKWGSIYARAACLECHHNEKFKDHDEYKAKILDAWSNQPMKFAGYSFIGITHNEDMRIMYQYTCAANHVRETFYNNAIVFGCSHKDHPTHMAYTAHDVEQKILKTWNENSIVFQGYTIVKIEVAKDTQHPSAQATIKCPDGHLSTRRAAHVYYGKVACSHRDCIARRIMRSAFSCKTLTQNWKTYRYQGYEHHLLKTLFKRFSTMYIDTNASLDTPKSYPYFFDGKIHYYFPDILVTAPYHKRWYEVKSTWTYDANGTDDDLREQNLTKWTAVATKSNRIMDAYIYRKDISIDKIIRAYPDGTFKSFRSAQAADEDPRDVISML